MTRRSAIMMLALAAFFWGAGNVANKTVLDHIGPLTAVSYRCLIAACVVIPWAMKEMRACATVGWYASTAFVSLYFCAAMALQQTAFETATVTNASFLVNTCSILTPIIAWVALRERPPARIICAAVVTLSGAFFMTGGTFSFALFNRGDGLCLLSAVFYAAWMVALGRHIAVHGLPFATSFVQFALSSAVLFPLSAAVEVQSIGRVVQAAPELIGLGVFSTAIAFVLQSRAQQAVSSSTAAIIVSAESLFGAAGAYVWLGEQTSGARIWGAVLIMSGIVIAAVSTRRGAGATGAQHQLPSSRQMLPELHRKTLHH
jgi:drug/metabolite transporter (DMT)-like permease